MAVAFANGALSDVQSILEEILASKGLTLKSLAWTSDGHAVGEANANGQAMPVFATAGPDGENPQVFTGSEAQDRQAAAALFTSSLVASEAIATDEGLLPGQTHVLSAEGDRRPRLERQRLYFGGSQ